MIVHNRKVSFGCFSLIRNSAKSYFVHVLCDRLPSWSVLPRQSQTSSAWVFVLHIPSQFWGVQRLERRKSFQLDQSAAIVKMFSLRMGIFWRWKALRNYRPRQQRISIRSWRQKRAATKPKRRVFVSLLTNQTNSPSYGQLTAIPPQPRRFAFKTESWQASLPREVRPPVSKALLSHPQVWAESRFALPPEPPTGTLGYVPAKKHGVFADHRKVPDGNYTQHCHLHCSHFRAGFAHSFALVVVQYSDSNRARIHTVSGATPPPTSPTQQPANLPEALVFPQNLKYLKSWKMPNWINISQNRYSSEVVDWAAEYFWLYHALHAKRIGHLSDNA